MSDSGEFVQRIKPFRRELLAHCYRMLGSVDDAEDVVQETYLRAWRAEGTFEARASLRAWLYKIATNACLTALEQRQRQRRALPSGLGAPSRDPHAAPVFAGPEVDWVEPIPDALVSSESDDPGAIAVSRQDLRLALIASWQHLPSRQRAVLLLREVLAFSAEEVAEMLDITAAAVKSMLQRARARLDEVMPAAEDVREPTAPEARALLDRYIAAFESSDAAAIEQLLCEDATLEMVPAITWFSGKTTCAPYIVHHALGSPGEWRMAPTRANGQLATIAYRRGEDGVHRAFGVAVLSFGAGGIARIVLFADPELVARFEGPVADGLIHHTGSDPVS
ncbi:sigma-70 family RNA polymerase sigma factor [Pendulispora albinea]|uniref:RNA polymerase sigma factor n=2 Tax=Pendulispora albinea TaxID=2741071 RepID=A0ABZ2M3L1_9BACT